LGLLSLLVTVAIYAVAKRVYRRHRRVLLSPIFVAPLLLVILLLLAGLPYQAYMAGGQWLAFLLGPATVAFAIPMYKNGPVLRRHALEIGSGVALGSLVALLSSILPALWMHLSPETTSSLAPRSVTTPIAMEISRSIGGVPTMTAVFVMITALVGLVVGPLLIRTLSLRSPVARGALLGMGAHGAGTARAFEFGSLEGTIASLSMIAAAGATLALTPVVVPLLLHR
jgi:predicted murein hydrolase (TIGR00659 family)